MVYKKTAVFIFVVMFCISLLSQEIYKKTKVSDDIELVQLSDNAWVHITYASMPNFARFASNGLVLKHGNEAILFDSPVTNELTRQLLTWLSDSMGIKITAFVPNHWHSDCMGGLQYLQSQNIKSYANQMTLDIAREKNLPLPDFDFTDSLILTLDKQIVECYYFGAAHSTDNIVVWLPAEKILFAGCIVKCMHSQNLGNTADGDLAAYPKTIDKINGRFRDAKIVVPGHGDFGGTELLEHTKKLTAQ